MDPREHHHFFAKQMIPTHSFRSPDKMFAELTGPKREAFLMFLWTEAGKGMAQPLKPVDVGRQPGGAGQGVVKLDVVGALRRGAMEVVVISMPPALAPNEAIFLALVREGANVRVFFLERCRNEAGGVSDTETVLAGLSADGTRSNFGFFQGDGLETFKAELGKVLGVSLDGLETSLAPVTMEAFVGAGGAPGGGAPGGGAFGQAAAPGGAFGQAAAPGGAFGQAAAPGGAFGQAAAPGGVFGAAGQAMGGIPANFGRPAGAAASDGLGGTLEKMLLVRAAMPPFFWLTSWVVPGLGMLARWLYPLLSLAIIISYMVWSYRLFDARRGKTSYSPGMAVGGWFIPLGNAVIPPLVLRDLWKAVRGPDGSMIVFLWWIFYLAEVMFRTLYSFGFAIVPGYGGRDGYILFGTSRTEIDATAASILSFSVSFTSMLIGLGAYGLWWFIVRKINEKA